MAKQLHILGISGSLRKRSFNLATLRALADLMPDSMRLSTFDLNPIPLFNPDLHSEPTDSARRLVEAIRSADGLVLASPEYNHSVTGAMKNALDWGSRRFDEQPSPLSGKPVGLISVATGGYGGVRGYQHLRDIAFGTNMHVLNRPMILVPHARSKFDDDLNLIDEPTRDFLKDFAEALEIWVRTINQA